MSKQGRRITSMVLAFVMILGTFSVSLAAVFDDVPEANAMKEYIDFVSDRGVMEGYGGAKNFGPRDLLQRSQLVKIVVEATDMEGDLDHDFTDVAAGAWYHDYVAIAVNNEVISGYPSGTFQPFRNITRQDAAKVIAEAFELEIVEGAELDFADADEIGSSLKDYVAAVVEAGIMSGHGDGTNFRPTEYLSRQQAAKMVAVAMGYEEIKAEAVEAVELAEESKLLTDTEAAQALVDELPEGGVKDDLNARLQALRDRQDDADAVTAQVFALFTDEARTELAEGVDQEAIDNARAAVEALDESHDDSKILWNLLIDSAQDLFDQAKIAEVDALIAKIKQDDIAGYSVDEDIFIEAKEAFDALAEDLQELISASNLARLEAAERALAGIVESNEELEAALTGKVENIELKGTFSSFVIDRDNVTITGGTVDDYGSDYGITVDGAEGVVIDDVTFIGGLRNAIRGFRTAEFTVQNSNITIGAAATGIYVNTHNQSSEVTLTALNNNITAGTGIGGTENSTIKIEGNTFNTSNEAIGLGVGVKVEDVENLVEYLESENTFKGAGEVVDYR